MNDHKMYDLRYFEPVIQKKDRTEFLQAFVKHLVWGVKMQSDVNTQLDFYLLVQMLHWEINVPMFRRMSERLDTYHSYEGLLKDYGRSLFSALRNRKKMSAVWEAMQEIPMMITLQEMATLAVTFYYQQGWGDGDDLKRELEATTL